MFSVAAKDKEIEAWLHKATSPHAAGDTEALFRSSFLELKQESEDVPHVQMVLRKCISA